MQSSDDQQLGKTAVQRGLVTQAQLAECVQVQSESRSPLPLGDVLVFKGYLTDAQVAGLKPAAAAALAPAQQLPVAMRCPACKIAFKVMSTSGGKSAKCPRCAGPLEVREAASAVHAMAEIATTRIRVVPPKPAAPSGPKVRETCIICDHTFEGSLDASGRVQCPSCKSTFSPRKR